MDDEEIRQQSRREALQRVGASLAVTPALLVGAAGAQTGGATAAAALPTAAPLVDPRQAYPKPPFPAQRQERPGLASRMNPRPDHGEQSYKGSGRLAGRKALITGGDSG